MRSALVKIDMYKVFCDSGTSNDSSAKVRLMGRFHKREDKAGWGKKKSKNKAAWSLTERCLELY